jgi:hypothetical protein
MLFVKLFLCFLNLWKLVMILAKFLSTVPKDLTPRHTTMAPGSLASCMDSTAAGSAVRRQKVWRHVKIPQRHAFWRYASWDGR